MPREKPEFVEGDKVEVRRRTTYTGEIIKTGRFCGEAQYLVAPDNEALENDEIYYWFSSYEMRPA